MGRIPFYHQAVKNHLNANMLNINNYTDFIIGYNCLSSWPQKQYLLLPGDNTIENNLIMKQKGESFKIVLPAPDKIEFTPKAITYTKNVLYSNEKPSGHTAGIQFKEFNQFNAESNQYDLKKWKPLTDADVGPVWSF